MHLSLSQSPAGCADVVLSRACSPAGCGDRVLSCMHAHHWWHKPTSPAGCADAVLSCMHALYQHHTVLQAVLSRCCLQNMHACTPARVRTSLPVVQAVLTRCCLPCMHACIHACTLSTSHSPAGCAEPHACMHTSTSPSTRTSCSGNSTLLPSNGMNCVPIKEWPRETQSVLLVRTAQLLTYRYSHSTH